MFVPVGFAVEAEDPTVVDDAVDDRGGHVPVSELYLVKSVFRD